MLKKILYAAVLASSSLAAHAAPETWAFTYTNLYDYAAGTHAPNKFFNGKFTGEDLNHDGILVLAELSYLEVAGDRNYITCGIDLPYYQECGAERFSYQRGGALDFSVSSRDSSPDLHFLHARGISSDRGFYDWYYTPHDASGESLGISSETIIKIFPVPEPETYAMFALGLLAIAGLHRRRCS